jgi:hypothetical protein
MNVDPATNTDTIKTWTPGTAFKFSLGPNVTNLTVETNDGTTLTGIVVGGPRDGQKMTWSLEHLPQIAGLSQ